MFTFHIQTLFFLFNLLVVKSFLVRSLILFAWLVCKLLVRRWILQHGQNKPSCLTHLWQMAQYFSSKYFLGLKLLNGLPLHKPLQLRVDIITQNDMGIYNDHYGLINPHKLHKVCRVLAHGNYIDKWFYHKVILHTLCILDQYSFLIPVPLHFLHFSCLLGIARQTKQVFGKRFFM